MGGRAARSSFQLRHALSPIVQTYLRRRLRLIVRIRPYSMRKNLSFFMA